MFRKSLIPSKFSWPSEKDEKLLESLIKFHSLFFVSSGAESAQRSHSHQRGKGFGHLIYSRNRSFLVQLTCTLNLWRFEKMIHITNPEKLLPLLPLTYQSNHRLRSLATTLCSSSSSLHYCCKYLYALRPKWIQSFLQDVIQMIEHAIDAFRNTIIVLNNSSILKRRSFLEACF